MHLRPWRRLRIVATTVTLACAVGLPATLQGPAHVGATVPGAHAPDMALGAATPLASSDVAVALELYVPPRDPTALAAFIRRVSTPGSPAYHHYLAKGAFASRFGASGADLDAIRHYVEAHGLHYDGASADHLFVRARGPVRVVERLFDTRIAQYDVQGRRDYANVTPPVMPVGLRHRVDAVVGLSDLPEERPSVSIGRRPHSPGQFSCSQMTSGTNPVTGPFTIAQVAATYGFGAFTQRGDQGHGQTIALFELTNYFPTDVSYYEGCLGEQLNVSGIQVDGGGFPNPDANVEADLDIEIAATVAPKADIVVYEGPNSEAGVVDTYQRIAIDDTAQVASTSWGLCETALPETVSAEAGIFAEMAAQGQTIVAASGDTGEAGCLGVNGRANWLSGAVGVQDPASQPYVTAAGGTSIRDAATIGSVPHSEVVWDTSDQEGGGGGVSKVWPQPWYQAGIPGAPTRGRTIPDVALDADPASGYMVYSFGNGWLPIGGTSAAAPLFASMVVLANEADGGRFGFLNPLLYQLAVEDPGTYFHDVTIGNNRVFDLRGFQRARVGYDGASGWGSPIASAYIGLTP
jgi:subtilase family serine protease